MPTLPELQADFGTAVLREDARAVAPLIVPDGLPPAARVQVYWNHVFSSLTEALEATYPVICRLVDQRFFGFAADRYIRRHPPAGPCLFEYGATFPDFLASFPPCAGHPYLADVARLEWALNAALHAEDAVPIDAASLSTVPSDDVGRLALQLDPSATWIRSPWPLDRIWRANQPDADPRACVELTAGGVALEVRRGDDVVTFRHLALAELVFRSALSAGTTLARAADAAMAEYAQFDLAAAIRALLEEELLVGLTSAPAKGDLP